ncbi:Clp protease N-terminal domain-containing protein [Actinomadura oligospora]|uniref:Clp protease N-terminal domain-containing protein n=1 Tax=Actinomadura oligospora TaxID=111804 RepID=UPI00047C46E1|nr:Clp protease N-terminal domain-containing protein [Actinomadura oligospora]
MARTYVDALLVRASEEARLRGARLTEAEHVLLALAGEAEGDAPDLLAPAGLDRRAVQDALRREFEHSLGEAGVSVTDEEVLRPRESRRKPSDIGESGRRVLEVGMASARKRDLGPAHILLGILELKVGTVPRALALAGVDVEDLRARARARVDGA